MAERWTTRNCDIYDSEYFGKAINSNQAKQIAKRHNADCDAYEARIAELEAKLAESLRVVEITPRPLVAHDWYMTPSGLGWWGRDKDGNECVETPDGYHEHADCKPVRLERWETEDGN